MNKIFRFSLIVLLLAIVGSASYIFYAIFWGAEVVSVPEVRYGSVLDAVDNLKNVGLVSRIEQEESGLPKGTVISQWPEPGKKMRKSAPVILKISKGTAKKPLPDLRDLTLGQASQRLAELQFQVGDIVRINSDKPSGVVVGHNPAAPVSIPINQPVDILVSMGPKTAEGLVVVPDVLNRSLSVAKGIIEDSGLKIKSEEVYTRTSPAGMVIEMSPRVGRQISRNSVVTVKVATNDRSKAPQPTQTQQTQQVLPSEGQGQGNVVVVGPRDSGSIRQINAANVVVSGDGLVHNPNATTPSTPTTQDQPKAPSTKTAHIRYQVPPTSGLDIRIELTDSQGVRDLIHRKTVANEMIVIDAPYKDEAVVTVYLGEVFVWGDRFK